MKKKITLVKVGDQDHRLTPDDLDRVRKLVEDNNLTDEIIIKKHLTIEEIETNDQAGSIMLVKIGDENYIPTPYDLEAWREVFEQAKGDPDFKIFTHSAISIDKVNLDDDVKAIIYSGLKSQIVQYDWYVRYEMAESAGAGFAGVKYAGPFSNEIRSF